ncbi:MAG: hypothetical protein GQ583_10820 [Methyloprofundus sp.]|nr:hypothetical protein [Methyloprofundus sp.]
MQEKQRSRVQGSASVIGLGKSKRLMAMRQSVESGISREVSQSPPISNKKEREIQQARAAIGQSIATMKASYPQAMKNKLFALRYGSDEEIKQMTLQKLFTLLNIKQVLAKEFADLKFEDKQD